MHPVHRGESSSGPSVQPIKRKISRLQEDPSLNHDSAPLAPPGFEGPIEYPKADYIVGQDVSGVIESTFEGGCLLSIRIENSSVNSRGIIFKPGHYHVTVESNVAPNVQLIRINDVHRPSERSRGQRRATKTSSNVRASHKFMPYMAPSVSHVGVRGTWEPVVLRPVNFANNKPPPNAPETKNGLASRGEDVHMIEPTSLFSLDQSIHVMSNQNHPSSEVGRKPNNSGSFNDGTEKTQKDVGNLELSTEIDTLGTSRMLGVEFKNNKEVLESSTEDSGIPSIPEIQNNIDPFLTDSLQAISGGNVLFIFGDERRTKLIPRRRGTRRCRRI